MKEPATLREAYDLYKANKYLRQDMIGQIVSAIEGLQGRIGNVDEAAVAALGHRMASVETTIGNALARAPVMVPDLGIDPGALANAKPGEFVPVDPPKRGGWPKGKPRGPAAPTTDTGTGG